MISLPKDPTGGQFEDLVTSALLVGGHFVEAQMKLRDEGKEILELDVVATPAGGGLEERSLFEVKKSGFSFSTLFKLYGQSAFLGISKGGLISASGCEEHLRPIYEQRAAEMGLGVLHVEDGIEELGPPPNDLEPDRWDVLSAVAWDGTIARRVALGELRQACKVNRDVPEFEDPREYQFNSRASFFLETPLERAEALYNAYFAAPRMSGRLVTYEVGRQSVPEEAIWSRVRDYHDYLHIQSVMDLESMARFAIVKNAFDDYLDRGEDPPPNTTMRIGSLALQVPEHGLPTSFLNGLDALKGHPHAPQLPYLFQAFYLLFGGFLSLESQRDAELLGALAGIPADEVVSGLRLIDDFFGSDNTFFFNPKDALLCLKMVPGIVRGAGAFFRQTAFGFESYQEEYPTMGWLISRWHNALYHALVPILGEREGASQS